MATSTLGNGTLVLAGTTSGTTTLQATAVAGTTTLTLPAATDTLVGRATTDTLTNKTLTGAAMNGTVGATTPNTGAFTTLSATGNITNSNSAGRLDFTGGSSAQVWATASSLYLDASAGQSVIIRPNNQVTAATVNAFGIGIGSATPSSGTGITFPATQNASSNANTLDDYEEGTWTPTNISGMTGFSAIDGTYTKIGRAVQVRGSFSITSVTSNMFVGGLPFPSMAQTFYSIIDQNVPVAIAFKRVEASSSSIQWNVNATGSFSVTISFTAWYFSD
jgi:hypothetical protein